MVFACDLCDLIKYVEYGFVFLVSIYSIRWGLENVGLGEH